MNISLTTLILVIMTKYSVTFQSLKTNFKFDFCANQKGFFSKLQSTVKTNQPVDDIKSKIVLFNTATKTKEKFEPMNPPRVSFYSCGPTVYDYAHIGNFRAFLTYDILKRWLQYCGYDIEHICNLTDIDDKIIIKMKQDNKSLKDVTEFYTKAFFDDLDVLNIKRANKYPKATEYIKEMETMIDKLVQTGHAYTQSGSVYYRVSAFKSYGSFSNMKFDDMIEGAGGAGPNQRRGFDEKESNKDFALWKAFTDQDNDVYWDTKFGKGRPGWHIECSAMCCKLLGPSIDIHAGGIDLVFPHHQNEIAQTEAYTGEKFSRYWIHNGFVNINNEKMSKSLKNFKTLRDIATSPLDARAFRLMVVSSQYRNSLNFSPETFKSAINSLKRLDRLLYQLNEIITNNNNTNITASSINVTELITSSIEQFEDSMCDDMNTPKAISSLYNITTSTEKLIKSDQLSYENAKLILNTIHRFDQIFGIIYNVNTDYFSKSNQNNNFNEVERILKPHEIPSNIQDLINQRNSLKDQKKYSEADIIRKELLSLGYAILDKKGGEYDILRKI